MALGELCGALEWFFKPSRPYASNRRSIEVGHAAQNILLQAAALGLAAVPVGSLDPSRAADTLALPPDQTVLYLIPVGHDP